MECPMKVSTEVETDESTHKVKKQKTIFEKCAEKECAGWVEEKKPTNCAIINKKAIYSDG